MRAVTWWNDGYQAAKQRKKTAAQPEAEERVKKLLAMAGAVATHRKANPGV